jgi:hypothetical protein
MAQALLERETIDREEVQLLAAGKSLPPVVPAEPRALEPPPSVPPDDRARESDRGPVLGTPGAEPAGA